MDRVLHADEERQLGPPTVAFTAVGKRVLVEVMDDSLSQQAVRLVAMLICRWGRRQEVTALMREKSSMGVNLPQGS